MECPKCNDVEMKHYSVNSNLEIWGKEHKINGIITQIPHGPRSAYVCDKCGYMEFNTKECENPSI